MVYFWFEKFSLQNTSQLWERYREDFYHEDEDYPINQPTINYLHLIHITAF